MMLKEKSNPWARLKYLYVLPLAAITVTAFARPEISEKAAEISAVKVNDLTAIVETKVAENIPSAESTVVNPTYSSTSYRKGYRENKTKRGRYRYYLFQRRRSVRYGGNARVSWWYRSP